ncbi:class V lanthionine synthetase subunit LxmK [Nocardiopsis sp. CC223A]|uniref:class V lanthionine synthetase subunit LxmK n=1 Tax=Nocardiopsis sp. CC223A TaxID=3044051 RepID=UPI00278BEBE6|nr:class V lanthionine synthetase subunit LxmK [Nocardiopsis sp. CC223A]
MSPSQEAALSPDSPSLSAEQVVDRILLDAGLGELDRHAYVSLQGRNDVWAAPTTSEQWVLVKRMLGQPDEVATRMRRVLDFERLASGSWPLALRTPPMVGHDASLALVIYEYQPDGVNGGQIMAEDAFPQHLARKMGASLAQLHELDSAAVGSLDDSRPILPSPELLEGIPDSMFESLSINQMEVWRILQGDAGLREGVSRLLEQERLAPRVPAHCDVRMDQFLVVDDEVILTDWEEFRLADAARDVGSFIGEWMYRAILDIVTVRGDAEDAEFELDERTILTRGVEKILRLQPVISAFWDEYMRQRTDSAVELTDRALAFAGWHMIDRLLAGAAVRSRISGVERAAAGVGRRLLISPGKYVRAMGMG